MTENVARLIELYVLLEPATPPGGEGWRAEQMRLLTHLTPKESADYYREIAKRRRQQPQEIIEWPA